MGLAAEPDAVWGRSGSSLQRRRYLLFRLSLHPLQQHMTTASARLGLRVPPGCLSITSRMRVPLSFLYLTEEP